jgi:hypothetical protein
VPVHALNCRVPPLGLNARHLVQGDFTIVLCPGFDIFKTFSLETNNHNATPAANSRTATTRINLNKKDGIGIFLWPKADTWI